MSEEDKKLQKHLVDEMMKVSKTNPDVMLYMQSLMKNYEKLEQENKQLKELCDKYEEEHKKEFKIWLQEQNILRELEKWLKEKRDYYNEYDYYSNFRAYADELDDVLIELQELKEKYK